VLEAAVRVVAFVAVVLEVVIRAVVSGIVLEAAVRVVAFVAVVLEVVIRAVVIRTAPEAAAPGIVLETVIQAAVIGVLVPVFPAAVLLSAALVLWEERSRRKFH
jgi:hypothetical protein